MLARPAIPFESRQAIPFYRGRRARKCCLERHDRFEMVKALPVGGQGRAEVVSRQSNHDYLVRKFIPHNKIDYFLDRDDTEPVEVRILRDFLPDHDRIIEFLDYSVSIKECTLYYKYYGGGDLHDLIDEFQNYKERIPELMIWQAFLQIAQALIYLHYGLGGKSSYPNARWRRVIHRDIKPANILLRNRITPWKIGNVSLVLADFGLSTTMEDLEDVGTFEFQPPEPPPMTERGDIWGLGATIHAMAHENMTPLHSIPTALPNNFYERQQWRRNPRNYLVRSFADKYTMQLELIMFQTLEPDPERRINSLELVKLLEKQFATKGQAAQLQRQANLKSQ